MKLNLGSGWHYLKGYTNVDLHHDADVKADLRDFEAEDGSVEMILTTHVIEHFTKDDGIDLLKRCFRWLEPGGRIVIETPDCMKCWKLIFDGKTLEGAKGLHGGRSVNKRGWHDLLLEWSDRCTESADKYHLLTVPAEWNLPGEAHLYVWTGEELRQALRDVGFDECTVERPVHHGGRVWRDTRVCGRKPR